MFRDIYILKAKGHFGKYDCELSDHLKVRWSLLKKKLFSFKKKLLLAKNRVTSNNIYVKQERIKNGYE